MPKRKSRLELKLDPKNARHHGKRNKELIRQSLAEVGGFRSIGGLLKAARAHGLHARLLDLRNSGDTAGPRDRVVGYGAYVLE